MAETDSKKIGVRSMTASLSHSHTGSCDFWIVRLVAIGPRCERSAMFAMISSGGRIRRSISARGPITKDWRIPIARAIVGNRATSGSDQRPMFDQLLRPTTDRIRSTVATDRTIIRDGRRPMVRSIVASCMRPIVRALVASRDRAYDQSWHRTADRTINRGATIDRTINRSIMHPIVATYYRSYSQSWHRTTDRTINRIIVRPIVRSIVRLPIRDHPQLVVPPCTTGGTIT